MFMKIETPSLLDKSLHELGIPGLLTLVISEMPSLVVNYLKRVIETARVDDVPPERSHDPEHGEVLTTQESNS